MHAMLSHAEQCGVEASILTILFEGPFCSTHSMRFLMSFGTCLALRENIGVCSRQFSSSQGQGVALFILVECPFLM